MIKNDYITDSDYYLLALTFVRDVGPLSSKKLLAHFKDPKRVFKASEEELAECPDIGPKKAKAIKNFQDWDKVEVHLKKLQDREMKILRFTDTKYPQNLREIEDAPIVLYYKGEYLKQDSLSIAVVGSRSMSDYGRKIASELAFGLASVGVSIISGFARGIDTVAHLAALKAKGRTIAVLGSGIDVIYPKENRTLYSKIMDSGCVISEFPLKTPPDKHNFPRRNRLISGLSLGVLVIEATASSGSLITAQYALDQNKEVFAVPGRIDSALSQGTNQLIKKGAKLVQKTEDILDELLPQLKGLLKTMPSQGEPLEINDRENAIFSLITEEPIHIDTLVRASGIPAEEALSLLLNLEIKGLVRQKEGKRFCKA